MWRSRLRLISNGIEGTLLHIANKYSMTDREMEMGIEVESRLY